MDKKTLVLPRDRYGNLRNVFKRAASQRSSINGTVGMLSETALLQLTVDCSLRLRAPARGGADTMNMDEFECEHEQNTKAINYWYSPHDLPLQGSFGSESV